MISTSTTLNEKQKDAVYHKSGPLMILAGAGTGKTKVISSRIAYLVSQYQINPQNIAAMTFTNKAANEMRQRVSGVLGSEKSKYVFIGTFHRFCLNIIREHSKKLNLSKNFNLIGSNDQLELVKKALTELSWSHLYQADRINYEIGICKNNLLTPQNINKENIKNINISDQAVLVKVYECYERLLNLNDAIDFDDCMLKSR